MANRISIGYWVSIMNTISQVEDIHYCHDQRLNIITVKLKTLDKCRIGGTCFTSVAIFGRKLFTSNS